MYGAAIHTAPVFFSLKGAFAMRFRKRLAALVLPAVLCISLLAGCAKDGEGVALSVCVGPEPQTLDPIYAREITDQTVLTHLYENLMRVVSDGSGGTTVVSGMAKSVDTEKNHDGTVTYTFRLRSAKWSDGRAVRASDFVYAWRRLADPASGSPYASLLSIVSGYQEARAAGDMDLLQVSAKNDSTLVVVLDGYYDWFLTQVCTAPATMPLRQDVVLRLKDAGIRAAGEGEKPAPWWNDPKLLVTNGPFCVAEADTDALRLTVNDRYYGDQPGPRELTFRFAANAEEAWTLYDSKTVDAVWPLPQTRMQELAADEGWTAIPTLGTYSAVFNCGDGIFGDPLVREALQLAIDRNALAETAGVTARPAEGLVPPGVPENEEGDFRTVGGALLDNDSETYGERRDRARELLSEAGYDSGSDLGELEYLYEDKDSNGLTAQALCQQWRDVLGVHVTPRGVTEQELWAALRSGSYTVAGVELTGNGNDAECFLSTWTSHDPDNVARYENSAYDTLMAIIANAPDGTARMGCLHDAEDLLISDYILAPLYTSGTAWEVRDTLTGAFRDARGWFGFSNVITRTA